jgi:hypothetical protein
MITLEASPGKKLVRYPPISINKLGVAVYACNPNYDRGIARRISV